MAVTLDQATVFTLASSNPPPTGAAVTFNTTAAVASGAHIVAVVGRFNASTPTSTLTMSGGGLTWTPAHTIQTGSLRMSVFVASAPAGLASGTALTITCSAASNDFTACASSYLGIDTTGTIVGTPVGSNGSAAGWSSGNKSVTAGNALIGGSWGDGTLRTSTPTSPAVERNDFNSSATGGSVTLVDKLSISTGNEALAGTWSGAVDHIDIAVELKATAGGTDATVTAVPADGVGDVPVADVSAGANVDAVPADGTGDVPAPSTGVTANVDAVPADGTGDVPAPEASAGANVDAVPADGTGDIPVADLPISSEVTTGPLSGTGDAPSPSISGEESGQVNAVPADGTGDVPAPGISSGANVDAVPADGTGDGPAPSASAGSDVSSAPADGTGDMAAPSVSGTAAGEVAGVAADGTGDVPEPSISASSSLDAPAADGTGDVAAPAPSAGASISTPPASGIGGMLDPIVTAGGRVMPRIDLPTSVFLMDPVSTAVLWSNDPVVIIDPDEDSVTMRDDRSTMVLDG